MGDKTKCRKHSKDSREKQSKLERIRYLLSRKIHTKKLKACNIDTKSINTQQLLLNDVDVACVLNRPPVTNIPVNYDCMDENNEPIKPDYINQQIWDFLNENREKYRIKTEDDQYRGRNQIRCIRQAYGCDPVLGCPPDCYIPDTCVTNFTGEFEQDGTVLNVTSVQPNSRKLTKDSEVVNNETDLQLGFLGDQISGTPGEVGQYEFTPTGEIPTGSIEMSSTLPCPTVEEVDPSGIPLPCPKFPPECIPDPNTCDLFVPSRLYKTMSIPWVLIEENKCGGGEKFPIRRFPGSLNFDLDVTNTTCNLATRTVTILVHYAYKSQTAPKPPIDPCTGKPILQTECLNLPENDIVCGVLRYNCCQFYYTINIEIGENFSGTVNIPSNIIEAIFNQNSSTFNPNDITGVFQLAIFVEDGLEVKDNSTARGGGGKSENPSVPISVTSINSPAWCPGCPR